MTPRRTPPEAAPCNRSGTTAFTLVELLVVLVVLALWAMLLLPALARTQLNSRAL